MAYLISDIFTFGYKSAGLLSTYNNYSLYLTADNINEILSSIIQLYNKNSDFAISINTLNTLSGKVDNNYINISTISSNLITLSTNFNILTGNYTSLTSTVDNIGTTINNIITNSNNTIPVVSANYSINSLNSNNATYATNANIATVANSLLQTYLNQISSAIKAEILFDGSGLQQITTIYPITFKTGNGISDQITYNNTASITIDTVLYSKQAILSEFANKLKNNLVFKVSLNLENNIIFNGENLLQISTIYQAISATTALSALNSKYVDLLLNYLTFVDKDNNSHNFDGTANVIILSILSSNYSKDAISASTANTANYATTAGNASSADTANSASIADTAKAVEKSLKIYDKDTNEIEYNGSILQQISSVISSYFANHAIEADHALRADVAGSSLEGGSISQLLPIYFKDIYNQTVQYDGTIQKDLTDGIYYAETANTANTADTANNATIADSVRNSISFQYINNLLYTDSDTIYLQTLYYNGDSAVTVNSITSSYYSQKAIQAVTDQYNNNIANTYLLKTKLFDKNYYKIIGNDTVALIIKDFQNITEIACDLENILVANNGLIYEIGELFKNITPASNLVPGTNYYKINTINNVSSVFINKLFCGAVDAYGKLYVWGKADNNWFGLNTKTDLNLLINNDLINPTEIKYTIKPNSNLYNKQFNIMSAAIYDVTSILDNSGDIQFDTYSNSIYKHELSIDLSMVIYHDNIAEFLEQDIYDLYTTTIEKIAAYIAINLLQYDIVSIYSSTLPTINGVYVFSNLTLTNISINLPDYTKGTYQNITQGTDKNLYLLTHANKQNNSGNLTYLYIKNSSENSYEVEENIKWSKIVKGIYGYGALALTTDGKLYGAGKNKDCMFGALFVENNIFNEWVFLPINYIIKDNNDKIIDIKLNHNELYSIFTILTDKGYVLITGNTTYLSQLFDYDRLPLYTKNTFDLNSKTSNNNISEISLLLFENNNYIVTKTYNYDYNYEIAKSNNALHNCNKKGWFIWGNINNLQKLFNKIALSPSAICGSIYPLQKNYPTPILYNGMNVFFNSNTIINSSNNNYHLITTIQLNNLLLSNIKNIYLAKDTIILETNENLFINSKNTTINTALNIEEKITTITNFNNNIINLNTIVKSNKNGIFTNIGIGNTILGISSNTKNINDITIYEYITNNGSSRVLILNITDNILSSTFANTNEDIYYTFNSANNYLQYFTKPTSICLYSESNIANKYYLDIIPNNIIFNYTKSNNNLTLNVAINDLTYINNSKLYLIFDVKFIDLLSSLEDQIFQYLKTIENANINTNNTINILLSDINAKFNTDNNYEFDSYVSVSAIYYSTKEQYLMFVMNFSLNYNTDFYDYNRIFNLSSFKTILLDN